MVNEKSSIESIVDTYKLRKKQGTSLLDKNFKKQTQFIQDEARLKAMFCTRRAAKSYTGGLELMKGMEDFPGKNFLYLGLTRSSAKGIIWKDVFKDIDRKHSLGMEFNKTDLTMTHKNESVTYISGIDADEDEMEKLLGKKYKKIFLDEASLYSVNLRKLIYGILGPAVIDDDGTIIMGGTSGDLTQGLFFDVTRGTEPGWKLHQWSAHDNPYIADKWQAELDKIERDRPAFKETPLFKQWYLNQWVIDENKLVYRFNSDRNKYQTLPRYKFGEWNYVLGVDLGYDPDPSAFVVCAFHENDGCLYLLECFKKTEMDVTDVANKIKEYQARYSINTVVIDGSNKQAVEEMQRRHGIALRAADKTGKSDFIQIMNAEMIQSKIKVSDACKPLIDEWTTLIWTMVGDTIAIPRKENANCSNHITDAALYAWRFCYQFLSEPAKPQVDLRDPAQYISHTQKLMEERLQAQIDHEQAADNNSDIFATSGLETEQDVLSYYLNKRK